MIVLVWAVGAVHSQTLRDTIHTVSRNYYYDSSWYTQCCTYYYDSVSPRDRVQLDLCRSQFNNLSGMHYLCKKFSTEYPLTIKGLSCMSPRNLWDTSCTYGTFPVIFQMSPDATPQVPDYLYLFQYDSVDGKLQMYDSVRWDTATAKVLELSLHSDPAEGYCYTYVYEVMLHTPVTVTGDFYVAGSRWNTAVDSMERHLHYPRVYQMFQYLLVDYYQQGDDWHYSEAYCFPRNNGFLYPRHLDSLFTSQVSNDSYRYLYPKLFGPFFPIVDSWLVEINTSDSTLGRVWPNSGYYPDSTICNIVARPTRAGRFLGWSDGVLSPTRVERVTSDITLTAYFEAKDTCYVRAVSGNGHWGTVAGGGMYFDGDTVTLTAVANRGYIFSHWENGDTANPRQVVVTSDSSFTAYFDALEDYTITANVNNEWWGHVRGAGLYYYGEEVKLVAVPKAGHAFLHWDDGSPSNMKIFIADRDTAFVAYFDEYSGIGEVEGQKEALFSLRPNPARGVVTVKIGEHVCDVEGFRLTLYDASGRTMVEQELRQSETTVDISHLSAGVYLAVLVAPQGVSVQKLAVGE